MQTLTDDARVEGDETFAVTVAGSTLPAGVVVPAGTLAVGRIRDADRATVTVEAVAPATEGVSVSFRVTLSDPVLPEDIVVRWSTGDDASPNARQATADEDYAAEADRSVMIPASATGATFKVVTLADDLQEDAETFAVTLTGSSLPGKVEVPADARAIGTIREPVTMPPPVRPPPPPARVTLAAAEATEGRPVEFTVSLSRTASSPVPLTWSTTDATASAGEDYIAITAQAVKAVHLTELRDRIDDLRMAHGLQRFAYMDPPITAGHTRVRAVHLVELRTALDQTYDAAERRRPRYTGAVGADAAVRAVHINDLRRSIQALE